MVVKGYGSYRILSRNPDGSVRDIQWLTDRPPSGGNVHDVAKRMAKERKERDKVKIAAIRAAKAV